MAKKQTGLYRANVSWPGGSGHYYYYGRNADVVEQAVFEKFRAMDGFDHAVAVKVIKVGVCKYTVVEPVVEFTQEETTQIENYYFKEMIKDELTKQKIKQFAESLPGAQ